MVEVTKEARQRCAELAKEIDGQCWLAADFDEGGEVEARAFARYVQQVSDTASEIVRLLSDPHVNMVDVDKAEALARSLMLPEPVDPLVELAREAFARLPSTWTADDLAEQLRAVSKEHGLAIVKEGV